MAIGTIGLAGCISSDDSAQEDDGENGNGENDARATGEAANGYDAVTAEDFATTAFTFVDAETGEMVANVRGHNGYTHWHQVPVTLPQNGTRRLESKLRHKDETLVPIGSDGAVQLEVRITGETDPELLDVSIDDEIVSFDTTGSGEGYVVIRVFRRSDEEQIWESPPMQVVVS